MQWMIRGTALVVLLSCVAVGNAGYTNNIMLTGYWPPTNEAIRHFSDNPYQNPAGWVGENWEGLGYNIYSFFPEFENFPQDEKGHGDFEVDYQDTSADWWRITADVNPVAIITFSRTGVDNAWELELRQRNLLRSRWQPDYEAPFRPDNSPPDPTWPRNAARESTLPMQDIVDAVNAAGLTDVDAFIDDVGNGGSFLSEYIAYHGVWYQDMHKDASDPFQSVAAGHIHVGQNISVADTRLAAEISLRTLIDYVDGVLVPEPSSFVLLITTLFGLGFYRHRRRGSFPSSR